MQLWKWQSADLSPQTKWSRKKAHDDSRLAKKCHSNLTQKLEFSSPNPHPTSSPLSSSLSPCPSLAKNETEPGASDRQATWRSVTGSELQNPNVASDKANYTATCLLFNLCQQSAEELWIGQHKNKASGQQIDIVNGPNGTMVPRRTIRVDPGPIATTRIRTRKRSRSRSVGAFIEAKQNAEGCQGGGRTTLRCRQAKGKQLLPKLYSICFVFHAACSSSSLVSFFFQTTYDRLQRVLWSVLWMPNILRTRPKMSIHKLNGTITDINFLVRSQSKLLFHIIVSFKKSTKPNLILRKRN